MTAKCESWDNGSGRQHLAEALAQQESVPIDICWIEQELIECGDGSPPGDFSNNRRELCHGRRDDDPAGEHRANQALIEKRVTDPKFTIGGQA